MALGQIFGFEPMQKHIPAGQSGSVEIKHFKVDKDASEWTGLQALFSGNGLNYVRPGDYVKLKIGNTVFMSDTDMEIKTNREFVRNAHGRVLVAGLGIGLVIPPLLKKLEVSSLVILENNVDVIKLVAPHFKDPRLEVIHADVFKWKPREGERFNCIWFDIWPSLCEDNLPEMATLGRRSRNWIDRSDSYAWVGHWGREILRQRRRQERQSRW